MAKDPVCGMYVDEKTAEFKATVRGTPYFFCSHTVSNLKTALNLLNPILQKIDREAAR